MLYLYFICFCKVITNVVKISSWKGLKRLWRGLNSAAFAYCLLTMASYLSGKVLAQGLESSENSENKPRKLKLG